MGIRSTDCVPGWLSQRDLSNIVYYVFAPPEAGSTRPRRRSKTFLCVSPLPPAFSLFKKKETHGNCFAPLQISVSVTVVLKPFARTRIALRPPLANVPVRDWARSTTVDYRATRSFLVMMFLAGDTSSPSSTQDLIIRSGYGLNFAQERTTPPI